MNGHAADAVRARIAELGRRRAALAAGEAPTADSVRVAKQRAAASLDRARAAHAAAARRHDAAAVRHEQAASTHHLAATGDEANVARHRTAAARHTRAAEQEHLRAIEAQRQADVSGASSSGAQWLA